MSDSYENQITRRIEIDAAHRVPDHASKCKNIHGHRYVIEAICRGNLIAEGEQKGMVLDFGFLKEVMIEHIHDPCDHGLILYYGDPILEELIPSDQVRNEVVMAASGWGKVRYVRAPFYKLYVIDNVPTAEILAKHWFRLVAPAVKARSCGIATLGALKVWETPNCSATFVPEPSNTEEGR